MQRNSCDRLLVRFQRDSVMSKKKSATYSSGPDEAGFAIAFICLLLSLAPPLVVFLVPATFDELTRMDGLHRITAICSACFSVLVLMCGFTHHQHRSVLFACILGFVCLALSCVSGAGCCSGLLAWFEGKISVNDLPQDTLLNASLSPIGSLCLIFGHRQNLKWARRQLTKRESSQHSIPRRNRQ